MGKNILLLYNPDAGHGEHNREELIREIEAEGHICSSRSVKDPGWDKIPAGTDWLAVAGGDGTVRKVMRHVHERRLDQPAWPIGILPLGTANNIATSLGCDGTTAQLISNWGTNSTRFNTATVKQGDKESLMCEAAGFGLFAAHIQQMKRSPSTKKDPEEKVKEECSILLESLKGFKPRLYQIGTDGSKETGHYILLQVMNIPMIGPNLLFASPADPSDGLLDLVAFTDDDRPKLEKYLKKRIEGKSPELEVETVRAKRIIIESTDKHYHVEDDLFTNKASVRVDISVNAEALHILAPGWSQPV